MRETKNEEISNSKFKFIYQMMMRDIFRKVLRQTNSIGQSVFRFLALKSPKKEKLAIIRKTTKLRNIQKKRLRLLALNYLDNEKNVKTSRNAKVKTKKIHQKILPKGLALFENQEEEEFLGELKTMNHVTTYFT